ncbi:hypothetical protein GCM10009839_67320 [Catenulispora yoronensis]|uniref:Cupin domain-containing protein n=1 Tax=Catenulispora yoronensis TaxID=450799 RepID=A0ABP5GM84_9ACTN
MTEAPTTVPYTRIEVTADGGTRFVDGDLPLDPRVVATGVPPMLVGALPSDGGRVAYLRSEGFDSVPHPAPAVQWVVMLRGTVEATVSSGESRRFSPGELLLVTDVTGVGHRSAGVGEPPFECLFIPANPANPANQAGPA